MTPAFLHLTALINFIIEREAIRLRREAGAPWPWTRDEILANYRFCCVRREDDRVTRWLAAHWRKPHRDDPYLWFAMAVARLASNHCDTLAEIGFPVPWDPQHFLSVIRGRKAQGLPVESAAYMLRADNTGRYPEKALYLTEMVSNPLWEDREQLRPQRGMSLREYFEILRPRYFMGGGFYPGQIIGDLKYVEPLLSASDWDAFAVSGPGSRRGMNYVLGRDPAAPWDEREWYAHLDELIELTAEPLVEHEIALHYQDMQNCLCEFSKYRAAQLGKMPKRRFHPPASPGELFISRR